MSSMACLCTSGATPPMSYTPARAICSPMTSTTQHRAAVRAIGVRAAANEDSTERSETARLDHCATQRRLPLAHEENNGAAAAPRERSVFTASESVGLKTTDPLWDQAT
jgi:hypothetical protein